MKKAIITVIFVIGLLLSIVANTEAAGAVSDLKISAGIMPSSPFYVFDIALESVRAFFAISEDSKAQFYMDVAEERLSEAKEELSANSTANVDALMQDYQNGLAKAEAHAALSSSQKLMESLLSRLNLHLSVLESLRVSVPDNARTGIQSAWDNGQKAMLEIGIKNGSG